MASNLAKSTPKTSSARRADESQTRRSRAFVALLGLAAGALNASSSAAQQSLPVQAPNVVLTNASPEQSFLIDIAAMPPRPVLVVEATPPASHAGMQLQIETRDFNAPFVNEPGECGTIFDGPTFSTSGPGVARLSLELYRCGPLSGWWAGATALVVVRAIDFGGGGSPAAVSVVIRADTRPATSTLSQQVDINRTPREVLIPASKDTVIYAEDPTVSNGASGSLFAARWSLFSNPQPLRTLVAFDLDPAIPPPGLATIDYAELRLDVMNRYGDGLLALHWVFPQGSGWSEGDAIGLFSGVFGGQSSVPAADWAYRTRPGEAWLLEGGDPLDPPLVEQPVVASAVNVLASPSLVGAVYDMRASGRDDRDGFVLSWSGVEGSGVEIASRENGLRPPPTLQVVYTPTVPMESGSIWFNRIPFIDEGQNFRWIYDLDRDGTYVTPRFGICEAGQQSSPLDSTLPYTYRYEGEPFTGVDCCTWQIDSATGVVGTGQALFFHDLDASDPANMPPDADGDGIRDLCDNCPSAPNGPLRGSCRSGTAIGAVCRSDQECPGGGICDLRQADPDADMQGFACPEPGFAIALMTALGPLAAFARRRAARRRLH
jgi:hypothetical protein